MHARYHRTHRTPRIHPAAAVFASAASVVGSGPSARGSRCAFAFAAICSLLPLLLLTASASASVEYEPAAKLLPGDGGAWQYFGRTAAISGDVAVVGSGTESAYVFRYLDGAWTEEARLTPSSGIAGDRFGEAVAVSGDLIVIGARQTDDDVYAWATDIGAAYVFRHDGSTWIEEARLVASDRAKDDRLGTSVAVSGDAIVVGAEGKSEGLNSSGAAYVFRYDGSAWVEESKLLRSDPAALDFFGRSVALAGDVAVVGSPNDTDYGFFSGSAYVFEFDGSSWSQVQKLTASDAAEYQEFGTTLSLSGSTLVVGVSQGIQPREGAAYVFRDDGSSWTEEARLTSSAPSATEYYGASVSVSGETIVVGASGSSEGGNILAGAAYVYWYDGASWSEESRLTAPDAVSGESLGTSVAIVGTTVVACVPGDQDNGSASGSAQVFELTLRPHKLVASDGAASDRFGAAVALSGSRALVGAPDDEDAGARSGSAYVFEYDGQAWLEEQKLAASDAGASGHFGGSVALAGEVAVVGSPAAELLPGAAYVFRDGGVSGWAEEAKLSPSDSTSQDAFGAATAISGTRIVVGAPATDDDAVSGAAYVFAYTGSSWVQQAKLSASDAEANDEFGSSVAISGDVIVVGAHLEDAAGLDAGAAYVYRYDGSSWLEEAKLVGADVEADDEFGGAVAVSSDTLAVGAKRDDDQGADSGAVYVYGYDGQQWVETSKLVASDGMSVARFGIAVALSAANTVAVGAEYHQMKGAAYAFWPDGTSWIQEPRIVAPDVSTDYYGASIAISGDRVAVGSPYNDDVGAAYVSTLLYVPEPGLLLMQLAALATALGCVARRSL